MTGRCLDGLLRLDENGQEVVELGWVDVADGDDAQVWCGGGVKVESCSGAGQCGEAGAGGSLREEDGDLVFVDGEEEQSCGLIVRLLVSSASAGIRYIDMSRSKSAGLGSLENDLCAGEEGNDE